MTFRQKIKEFLTNKNSKRAVIIYLTLLAVGGIGMWIYGGDAGWYLLVIFSGFGCGMAEAFLVNGHKKPWTVASTVKFLVITAISTGISLLLGAPIIAVPIGIACGFLGGGVAIPIMRREAKKAQNE